MSFYYLFSDRYKIVERETNENTCVRITNKNQCEEATRQLGIFQWARKFNDYSGDFPPYCYMRSGLLYFNERNESEKCSAKMFWGFGDVKCVCKKGNVDHQTMIDPNASSHQNKCAMSLAAIPLQYF